MGNWTIRMGKKWQKFIEKQDPQIKNLLNDGLKSIMENPFANDGIIQKYTPTKVYKRRFGDFRILYMILKKIKIIDIVRIGNRKNVYD